MGDLLVTGLPQDRARLDVEGHQALARTAASHEHTAVFDHGRLGVLPGNVAAGVVLGEVLLPDFLAGLGVEGLHHEFGREGVHPSALHGGRGTRAVTAAIFFGAVIATVSGLHGSQGHGPQFLAGVGIAGNEGLEHGAA